MPTPKIERCPKCGKVPEVEHTYERMIMSNLYMVNCCELSDNCWKRSEEAAIDDWNDSPGRLRALAVKLAGFVKMYDTVLRLRNLIEPGSEAARLADEVLEENQ